MAGAHDGHTVSFRCADRAGPEFRSRSLRLHTFLGDRPLIARAWLAWKRIAHSIGNFQARLLLTIFYFTVMLPFGLAVRLFSDPLRIKTRPTEWLHSPDVVQDLPWARKP